MRLLLRSDPVPELPRHRHVPSAVRVKGTRRALAVSATAQARSERFDTTAERATVARLRAQSGSGTQRAAFSANGERFVHMANHNNESNPSGDQKA